jgi:hypothetical protein
MRIPVSYLKQLVRKENHMNNCILGNVAVSTIILKLYLKTKPDPE